MGTKKFSQAMRLVVSVLVLVNACATVGGIPNVPLPTEIKIDPPDPETPKELASCLGAWGGWWKWTATGNTTDTATALIVESINPKGALVVYSRGVGADGSPGWWIRTFAEIEKGSIVLRIGGIVRTFTCKGNYIYATYEQGGQTRAHATLTKTKFELAATPAAKTERAVAVETTADLAIVEKLIAGSPFSGTATFPTGTFEVEFSFSKDERGLKGALTCTTSRIASPGPLRQVEVKRGKVTFYTEIGVYYQLEFDREGNLIGDARFVAATGSVKLSPVKR